MKKNKILSLIAAITLAGGTGITPVLAVNEANQDTTPTPDSSEKYTYEQTTDDNGNVTTWKAYLDEDTVQIGKKYTIVNGTAPYETFYLEQTAKDVSESEVAQDDIPDLVKVKENEKDTEYVGSVTFGTVTGEGDEAVYTGISKTETKYYTITLPNYTNVGIYTYTLEEVQGTSAGVTYRTDTIKLVVSVVNADDGSSLVKIAGVHAEPLSDQNDQDKKTDIFEENVYDARDVEINKQVTGNMGDKSTYFAVDVELTGDSTKTYQTINTNEASLTYTVDGKKANPTAMTVNAEEATTFYIKHGETIKLENLPVGVTYTVKEHDYTSNATGANKKDYDAATYKLNSNDAKTASVCETISTVTGEDGTKVAQDDEVVITNNKGGEIDTGIITSNAPYIAIIGVVTVCAVVFFLRKRNVEE